MNFEHTQKTKDNIDRVRAFMRDNVEPVEAQIYQDLHKLNPGGDWRQWQVHPLIEKFKGMAKEQGLWNLFLPDEKLGQGLTTLEYAPLAEEMGRMLFAPEMRPILATWKCCITSAATDKKNNGYCRYWLVRLGPCLA